MHNDMMDINFKLANLGKAPGCSFEHDIHQLGHRNIIQQ